MVSSALGERRFVVFEKGGKHDSLSISDKRRLSVFGGAL